MFRKLAASSPRQSRTPFQFRTLPSGQVTRSQTPAIRAAQRTLLYRGYANIVPGTAAQVHIGNDSIAVTFPDGKTTSFLHVWLRDHCREPRSFHPQTKQRLIDTLTIPRDIKPDSVVPDSNGLRVTWPASKDEESYESFYPYYFLLKHSYNPSLAADLNLNVVGSNSSGVDVASRIKKVLWTKDVINASPPVVEFDRVMNTEEGVYEWLKNIAVYGFSFLKNMPPTPEATEKVVRRIAFIRETHYGGFWDFTSNLEYGDLAYSNVLLRSHTDTTYFTDSCGLQLFHLLSPKTSHKGGHNLLVDGFRAAKVFKEKYSEYYKFLSTTIVPSHADGAGEANSGGVFMRPVIGYPVFIHYSQLTSSGEGLNSNDGELVQVRWNADDRGVIGGSQFEGEKMKLWYDSLRAWEETLRLEEAELWTVMEPGLGIIFDNHRVFHGRSGFSGERRLCGAYISGEDYRSRLEGLARKFENANSEVSTALKKVGLNSGNLNSEGAWEGYL